MTQILSLPCSLPGSPLILRCGLSNASYGSEDDRICQEIPRKIKQPDIDKDDDNNDIHVHVDSSMDMADVDTFFDLRNTLTSKLQ